MITVRSDQCVLDDNITVIILSVRKYSLTSRESLNFFQCYSLKALARVPNLARPSPNRNHQLSRSLKNLRNLPIQHIGGTMPAAWSWKLASRANEAWWVNAEARSSIDPAHWNPKQAAEHLGDLDGVAKFKELDPITRWPRNDEVYLMTRMRSQ